MVEMDDEVVEKKHFIRDLSGKISGTINGHYTKLENFISKVKHPLLILLIIGIIIRVVLIPFTMNADLRYWGWIVNIIDNDLGLYTTEGYYYTPVWGYVLAISTFLGKLVGITNYGALVDAFVPYMSEYYTIYDYVMTIGFAFVVKLPLYTTDIVIGLLIHRFVFAITKDRTKAVIAFALWFFCPLVLTETGIHAMIDNMSALFLLLTVMLAYDRRYFCAGVSFTFAMMVKIFPACFIFLLVIWVFKKEGWNYNGLKMNAIAVLGAIAGWIVLNIPSILSNNIWETVRFLTDRLGTTAEVMNNILPLSRVVMILVALFLMVGLTLYLLRNRIHDIKQHISSMDPDKRERIAFRVFIAITALMVLAVLVYTAVKSLMSGGIIQISTVRIRMMGAMVSITLSMFIAYRFTFKDDSDDKALFTALMLTSAFLFIWMPLPQYPVTIIPMMVLFIVMVDRRYLVPFIMFATCMSLYELAMGGITALFSVASFTDLLSMDLMLDMLDFYIAGDIIAPYQLFTGMFGAIAYISLIYLPIKWLRENNWGRIR